MKIIFDLDGTLANMEHRVHLVKDKSWTEFYKLCVYDKPIIQTIRLTQALSQFNVVEIWTGRSSVVMEETIEWLKDHNVYYEALKMRKEGNRQRDDVLKERWLFELPKEDWPKLVFEDRKRVAEMWRRNGVMCCQVAEGDF